MDRLSKDFFQTLIRKHENDDSITITKVRASDAVDKGNNFASLVKRVRVKGTRLQNDTEIEYSLSLIVKQLVSNKIVLEKFHFDVIFLNEAVAYNVILPALDKHSATGSIHRSECLLADESIVVLKDLFEQGYSNVDKTKGFDVADAKLTLTELAKLHAASLVMAEKDPEALKEFPPMLRDIWFEQSNDEKLVDGTSMESMQMLHLEIALHVLREQEASDDILHSIRTLEELIKSVTTQRELITSDRPHRVMNHGDTWGNNIMISRKENKAILIDLQIMRFTSVAADLSYFLNINMLPKIRREYFEELLQHYLDIVQTACSACHVDVSPYFNMEWLKAEMKEFAIFGLVSALWLLPVFFYDTEHLDLNSDDHNEENDEGWMEISWHLDKMSPAYKERLTELVVDYAKNC